MRDSNTLLYGLALAHKESDTQHAGRKYIYIYSTRGQDIAYSTVILQVLMLHEYSSTLIGEGALTSLMPSCMGVNLKSGFLLLRRSLHAVFLNCPSDWQRERGEVDQCSSAHGVGQTRDPTKRSTEKQRVNGKGDVQMLLSAKLVWCIVTTRML